MIERIGDSGGWSDAGTAAGRGWSGGRPRRDPRPAGPLRIDAIRCDVSSQDIDIASEINAVLDDDQAGDMPNAGIDAGTITAADLARRLSRAAGCALAAQARLAPATVTRLLRG